MYLDDKERFLIKYGVSKYKDLEDELTDEKYQEAFKLLKSRKLIDKACNYVNSEVQTLSLETSTDKKYMQTLRVLKSINVSYKILLGDVEYHILKISFKDKSVFRRNHKSSGTDAKISIAYIILMINEYANIIKIANSERKYKIQKLNNLATALQDIIDLYDILGVVEVNDDIFRV